MDTSLRERINKLSGDVSRLTEIEVKEVSIVDRAANKRRFLIVKREEPMSDNAGTEVVAGEDGKLTAKGEEEEAKATSSPTHQALAEEAIDSLIEKVTSLKEKLVGGTATLKEVDELSDAMWPLFSSLRQTAVVIAKADVSKATAPVPNPVRDAVLRVGTEVGERLMSVLNSIKDAPSAEGDGDMALPAEYAKEIEALASLLNNMSEKYPTPKSEHSGEEKGEGDGAELEKAEQIASALKALTEATEKLTAAAGSISKQEGEEMEDEEEKKAKEKKEKEEEEAAKSGSDLDPEIAKRLEAVTKAVEGLPAIADQIKTIGKAVSDQGDRLAAIEKSEPEPNSGNPETVSKSASKDEETPNWPSSFRTAAEGDGDPIDFEE